MSALHGRVDMRASTGTLASSASSSLLPPTRKYLPPTGAAGTPHGQPNPYQTRPGCGARPISRYGRDLRAQFRQQLVTDDTNVGRSLVHSLPAIVGGHGEFDVAGALTFDLSRLLGKPRPGAKREKSFRIVSEDTEEF